jgi:hypothetical protein
MTNLENRIKMELKDKCQQVKLGLGVENCSVPEKAFEKNNDRDWPKESVDSETGVGMGEEDTGGVETGHRSQSAVI